MAESDLGLSSNQARGGNILNHTWKRNSIQHNSAV